MARIVEGMECCLLVGSERELCLRIDKGVVGMRKSDLLGLPECEGRGSPKGRHHTCIYHSAWRHIVPEKRDFRDHRLRGII